MTRYLISMAVRTGCVVLVVVVHGPFRWVFAVGAIGLPYVAVVMANASRRPREPDVATPGRAAAGSLGATPAATVPTPTRTPDDAPLKDHFHPNPR
jgi:ABC-type spermidine/putrescine transport system permease subunit II